MNRAVHLHTSGRFDRSWVAWLRDIRRTIRATRATVVTATETRNRDRALLPFFAWRRLSRGDAAVAWNRRVWRYVDHRAVRVGADSGYYKVSIAMLVVLHHRKTGERWLFGSWHAPVVKPGARDLDAGRRVYDQADSIHAVICELADAHGVDARVMSGDWNEPLTVPAERAKLQRLFHTMRVAVPLGYRGPGTGQNRISVIDGALVSARVEVDDWRVLDRIGSSDHSPVLQHLHLRAAGAKAAERADVA